MTEAEALDMAARAAGWADWDESSREDLPATHQGIRAHAKTLMENAALKTENERLREALEWALAQIEGRTRYDRDEQFENCLEIVRTTLGGSHDA